MVQRIIMPKLGQTVEESTVVGWLKEEGDLVAEGDILLEIETDKATLEVESFSSGTLLKILRGEGETVPVMATIGFIGEPGEIIPDLDAPQTGSEAEDLMPTPGQKRSQQEESLLGESEEGNRTDGVAESVVSPEKVESSRLLKITPRAAKLARENGIDPGQIGGSGPKGRIVERDVQESLQEHKDRGPTLTEEPRALPRIRQIIARRLTESYRSTPHFFVTVAVDMTDLEAIRSEVKEHRIQLSLNDFLLKAVALTLPEFPALNSRTEDGIEMQWSSRINLGIAVAIEEGLLVPVIFDADRLELSDIHSQAGDLIFRGRNGTLKPDEMQGSTFTISNMGMMNVENFTAIINPGESAILAVSSVLKKPTVIDNQVVIRSIMKMTLSADHRLIDGVMAAQFLNGVKTRLEDVELWKRLF